MTTVLSRRAFMGTTIATTAAICVMPSRAQAAVKAAKERKPAADFTLPDADGASVHLATLKGRVVLLNFWATWCGPCKAEMPWFSEFQNMYKDRGLMVVGVSMDDDGWTSVKPYLAKQKLAYRMVIGNDKLSHDFGTVESLPATFMIDRQGRIAAEHNGLVGRMDYEKDILQLLGEKA
ncbi:MAG TPA: TlpA disulfide reductase family protein [Bryobacteraceae bacterium]|nr:TlpA disulfide reductase family protein [Bryobacteraceae bacterium]